MAARKETTVKSFADSIAYTYLVIVDRLRRGERLDSPSIQKDWERLNEEFKEIRPGEWNTNNNKLVDYVKKRLASHPFYMRFEYPTSQIKVGSSIYTVPSLKTALLAWRSRAQMRKSIPSGVGLSELLRGSKQMKREELSPKERLEYDKTLRELRKRKTRGGKRKTRKGKKKTRKQKKRRTRCRRC